ncbi:putative peroxisomal carnitine O-octanoyltransferase [Apostichopus japonicus]|uniref:Putative peroxisomal carnitine O-octanoyltransferase n=1 Tax=Stichopus japonicus TaxID=307972 RepID=A0A2G8KVH2_STIJA|nr:putative peroxisomal carnitine O-octanoyltransferase [Apostichopus japonicus]
MATAKTEKTFQFEEDLPSLPVPSLEDSLQNYLDSVKVVVTPGEYEKTRRIVKEFEVNIGPKLHAELTKRAEKSKNWLEEWWEKFAYLQSREPVAVLNGATAMDGVNMSMWPPRDGTQLKRASQAIWVASKYFLKLRREEDSVDRAPNGNPISMHQLRSLFCSCREPGVDCDKMRRYFKTESEGPCPNHVIVLCNGHIFRLEVFNEKEELYGSNEILRQLVDIKRRCSPWQGQCIGVLTAAKRDQWGKAYNHMCSLSNQNADHFEVIRSAMFAVALDDETPRSHIQGMLAGVGGSNVQDRWYDKSYVQIIFESGVFIYTSDHTAFDGLAAFKLAIHNQGEYNVANMRCMGNEEIHESRDMPEELIFQTDDKVEEYKRLAVESYMEHSSTIDMVGSHIDCDRKWVKSKGFSPDAFMQMAIQLSYYTKYGRPGTCYETGATVMFYHGRTDTIRTCTEEMIDWCKAMLDKTKSRGEKIESMKAAHSKHHEITLQAISGGAFDRYLLGLYIISQEMGYDVPEIFLDETYTKSGGGGNFVLSTSQLGRFYQLGAVAPMVKNGYGVFYNLLAERYFATVISYKTCPETDSMEFFDQIRHSLMVMIQLLREGPAKL